MRFIILFLFCFSLHLFFVSCIGDTQRSALIDLYNSTNGDSWHINANWLQGDPCDNKWHGITCTSNWIFANSITKLKLTDNKLSGKIPTSISNLSNLQHLWLDYNNLTGPIPDSISELTNLEYLGLYKNQLTGSIPDSISSLSNLVYLSLNTNQLTGSIPDSISSLSKLQYLSLYNNQLTGSIPDSISNLSKLQYLYLNNNQFTGEIPNSISSLSNLKITKLYNNTISETDWTQESKPTNIFIYILILFFTCILALVIIYLFLYQTKKMKNMDYYREMDNTRDIMILNDSQMRSWMNEKKNIEAQDFTDIEFKGKGCDGLVMKASITITPNSKCIIALKMIVNIHGIPSLAHEQSCAKEFNILPELLQLHPNIGSILGKFLSHSTEEMINFLDKDIKYPNESIKDLCYKADGTVKSVQFFVLQYYEKTLDSVIKSQNLTNNKIIKYALQLGSGLYYLYKSKIVHLDIKTNNLMISSTGDLVIVDFGHAGKLRDDKTVDRRLTIGGNINHLAPEVIIARNNNRDLPCEKQYSWELGIVLYEMLSKGDHPIDTYATTNTITPLELGSIPNQYHNLLRKLICNEIDRITISDACNQLEIINQQENI